MFEKVNKNTPHRVSSLFKAHIENHRGVPVVPTHVLLNLVSSDRFLCRNDYGYRKFHKNTDLQWYELCKLEISSHKVSRADECHRAITLDA